MSAQQFPHRITSFCASRDGEGHAFILGRVVVMVVVVVVLAAAAAVAPGGAMRRRDETRQGRL